MNMSNRNVLIISTIKLVTLKSYPSIVFLWFTTPINKNYEKKKRRWDTQTNNKINKEKEDKRPFIKMVYMCFKPIFFFFLYIYIYNRNLNLNSYACIF